MRGKLILVYWLPAILWAAAILAASSDAFSARETGSLLESVITRLLGHPLPPHQFDLMHFVIRKGGHLTAYGILGALFFRALRGAEGWWRGRWAAGAVALAAIVATADEWHQIFVPARIGTGWDVLLDCVGATIAQGFWRLRAKEGGG